MLSSSVDIRFPLRGLHLSGNLLTSSLDQSGANRRPPTAYLRTVLVFELNGIILAANTSFVMTDDPAMLEVARRAVRRRLGADADS